MLIKNVTIIQAQGAEKQSRDVLIQKGRITRVDRSVVADEKTVIDGRGLLLLPGLVDLWARWADPGHEDRETMESGLRAASAGGFTTVQCLPWTRPVLDNGEMVSGFLERSRKFPGPELIPAGALTRQLLGEGLTDMMEMSEAGCRAVVQVPVSLDNIFLMMQGMKYAHMAGLKVMDPCSERRVNEGGVMHEGYYSTVLGLKGIPAFGETTMVARHIEMAAALRIPIHLAKISLRRSVELIRAAKADGIPVTASVTPQHITFCDEDLEAFNTAFKLDPPLRGRDDREALLEGLEDGTIDGFVSDHAPASREEKERDMILAPPGCSAFETAWAASVSACLPRGKLKWSDMSRLWTKNSSEWIGIDHSHPFQEGSVADLVLIDPEAQWIVEAKSADGESTGYGTPYEGRKLQSAIRMTIRCGKVIFSNMLLS